MKRFKNWIHGSLWAVIFGLGLYVLVKGVSIAGGGKNLTRKTAQLYAPVFTLAPVKGTENQSLLSLLTKEVVLCGNREADRNILGARSCSVGLLIRRAAADGTGRNR